MPFLSRLCPRARAIRDGRRTEKSIAFTSTTNPEDLAKQEKKKRKEEELKQAVAAEDIRPARQAQGERERKRAKKAADAAVKQAEEEAERESDVHVVTRAVYRGDNDGYYDFKRPATHLGRAGAAERRRESAPEDN